jgi:hypothetical protein
MARQTQIVNDRSATNQSAGSQDNPTAEVNAYSSFKGKSRNHILLATAIVEIQTKAGQYIPCRALLDSASQSHFITERCAQRLGLSRTQTNASVTDIINVNTATHHSVSLQLTSRHTDWHTTLVCAILSNITGTTPSTKLDTSTWKIPTDIKLADEQFDQPGGINLSIGADLFYEILRSGRRTRPGHPVLQETVRGWTLSGKTPVAATTTKNEQQRTFLLQEDDSPEHNPTHLREVDSVEQSSMSIRQPACNQQVKPHTTQQQDGGCVVKPQPKENHNQFNFFILLQNEGYSSWKTGGSDNLRIITITL